MTTRRSFLGSIFAAATPPGYVRAGVLMPVAPILLPNFDLTGSEILRRQAMFDRLMEAVREHDKLLYNERRWTDGELLRFVSQANSALVINRIRA